VTGSAGATLTVADATDASFDLPNGLPVGAYTVTLTTGSDVKSAILIVNTPTPAPALSSATVAVGTASGDTTITATASGSNTLAVAVSTSTIATPNVGDAAPTTGGSVTVTNPLETSRVSPRVVRPLLAQADPQAWRP